MSVKIEENVKVKLLKVAGEIQAKDGKLMTISDTIDSLIEFYNLHKEA